MITRVEPSTSLWSAREQRADSPLSTSGDDPPECAFCHSNFRSERARDDHLRDKHHHCAPCIRTFGSPNQILQHRRSKAHMPPKHPCACGQRFITQAALLKHLEYGGACEWGCNREHVDRFVQGAGGSVARLLVNAAYTDVSRRRLRATSRSSLNERTGLYDCRRCSAEFKSLAALNTHLSSAVHAWRPDLYQCPHHGCPKQFGLFSALVDHFEGGQCGARQNSPCASAIRSALRAVTCGVEDM
jgi:hypothetical protein